MAETSYPFGSSSIATEDQWSSMFRLTQVDGVYATDPTGTNLRVTGSNASTVQVAAGEAWVQGTYYANDAALNVSVPTNSGGGSARKDLVVLRRDPSSDTVAVAYKTGGTSFPSLTQTLNGTWEIPLAQVTVAAGASVVPAANVTDYRWFLGRPVVLSNSGSRPPATKGQLIVEGQSVYLGNGLSYDLLATAGQDTGWKTIPLASGYTASGQAPQYRVLNGIVYTRGAARRTTGDLPTGELTTIATLPTEARPSGAIRYSVTPTEINNPTLDGVRTTFHYARLEFQVGGLVRFYVPYNSNAAWIGFDFAYSL